MIEPVKFITKDEKKYLYDIERRTSRGVLSISSIADLHFGVNRVSPKEEYEILKNQYIDKIKDIKLDIISVCGDIFDRKFMSNTDAVSYAIKFISDLVMMCKNNNTTLIIIKGTDGHEAGQLKLFYHYLDDPDIDIRIVENIRFEYVKGSKILCIPELYGESEDVYKYFLYQNGEYDLCFMHGTVDGSVYNNNVGQGRLFTMNDFGFCKGPIISGHVHQGGCFHSHFYYTGSPIRYEFGEENTKGFLITLLNLDTFEYYMHLEPIESFKYVTVDIDDLILGDPQKVIEYINLLKEKENIDYLRIAINQDCPKDNLEIIRSYYKSNNNIKFKLDKLKKIEEEKNISNQEMFDKYKYLFGKMDEYDKLAKFINDDIGYIFTTGEQIKDLLKEKE